MARYKLLSPKEKIRRQELALKKAIREAEAHPSHVAFAKGTVSKLERWARQARTLRGAPQGLAKYLGDVAVAVEGKLASLDWTGCEVPDRNAPVQDDGQDIETEELAEQEA